MITLGRALPVTAITLALASPCLGDFYDGQTAYERGDHEAAYRLWEAAARDGDVESQYRLAGLLREGEGVAADPAAAVVWLERAAAAGHAQAQNDLGVAYETGEGVAVDPAAAAEWYRRSASQGRTAAHYNLAVLLDEGRGVEENPGRAADHYRRAAGRDHVSAQYRLALLFEEGRGVGQNDAKAAKWYRRAAEAGHTEAGARLEALRRAGRLAPSSGRKKAFGTPAPATAAVTPATPVETSEPAPPAAATPAPAGLERENPDDRYELARRFATGDGVEVDLDRAAKLYTRAAAGGHALATYRLGFVHMRGHTGSGAKDFPQAWAWFSLAAERGIGDADGWLRRLEKKMTRRERERAVAVKDEIAATLEERP